MLRRWAFAVLFSILFSVKKFLSKRNGDKTK